MVYEHLTKRPRTPIQKLKRASGFGFLAAVIFTVSYAAVSALEKTEETMKNKEFPPHWIEQKKN